MAHKFVCLLNFFGYFTKELLARVAIGEGDYLVSEQVVVEELVRGPGRDEVLIVDV